MCPRRVDRLDRPCGSGVDEAPGADSGASLVEYALALALVALVAAGGFPLLASVVDHALTDVAAEIAGQVAQIQPSAACDPPPEAGSCTIDIETGLGSGDKIGFTAPGTTAPVWTYPATLDGWLLWSNSSSVSATCNSSACDVASPEVYMQVGRFSLNGDALPQPVQISVSDAGTGEMGSLDVLLKDCTGGCA